MTSHDKPLDVAVIGAGLGGISAAVSLAAEGHNVDLYEKNDHVGGKLNRCARDGFSFDLGPSILTLPRFFESLFERAGERLRDHVDLRELDLQWRAFYEDDTVIDLYNDPELTAEENEYVTSSDLEDVRSFLSYSKGLYEKAEHGYFEEGLDTVWDFLFHYGPLAFYGFDYFSTVHEGVARHIDDPKLQALFDFFIKYVGSSPYDAPAMLNLLPYVQQEFGLWYVDGGLYNLAPALRTLLDRTGVDVHLNTEVTRLATDGSRVSGVVLEAETKHDADVVVSNMEVIPCYRRLIDREVPQLDSYEHWYEPSCSGLVMHLGVDRTYECLDHHNFFFSRDPRAHFDAVFQSYELPEDPTIYLVAASRNDPSRAPDGCESIKILPHIPHMDEDGDFSDAAYDAFEERIFDKLERMGLTDLRDHVVVEETLYPRDIQATYYSHRGAIYGVVSDQDQNSALKAPKQSEVLNDLYFTGGTVNPGAGMPMVTLCGQLVADLIRERT